MTVNLALFYNTQPEYRIAETMAQARMVFDPDAKKIKEKIAEHEAAIRKLEIKLGRRQTEMEEHLLPKAKEAKEEAKKIVELRRIMLDEFEQKIRAEKAL